MWKLDSPDSASNELGEKKFIVFRHGHFSVRETTWYDTKKFRGFMENTIASFPNSFTIDDARGWLKRHINFQNAKAEEPIIGILGVMRKFYKEDAT